MAAEIQAQNPLFGGGDSGGVHSGGTSRRKQQQRASVYFGIRSDAERAYDYTENVVISKEWAANPGGASVGGASLEVRMEDGIVTEAELEAARQANKAKEFEIDPNNPKNSSRYNNRLLPVDVEARDLVNQSGGSDDEVNWAEISLQEGEAVVTSVKCIEFENCPGEATGKQLGNGLMVLTVDEDGDHRLHFFMKHREAAFKANEQFEGVESASSTRSWCTRSSSSSKYVKVVNHYDSKHKVSFSYGILFLPKSLFHIHAYLEDESHVEVDQRAELKEANHHRGCWEKYCEPCSRFCFWVCSLPFVLISCLVGLLCALLGLCSKFTCCRKHNAKNENIGWNAFTSYRESMDRKLHEAKQETDEEFEVHHALEHKENTIQEDPIVGKQTKDTLVEKKRCIMFVYHDSRRSDYLSTAKVTLSTSETFQDIFSFVSRLETMIHDPLDDEGVRITNRSWKVIGAAKKKALSDGSSGFANVTQEIGHENSVRLIGWGVVLSSFMSMVSSFVAFRIKADRACDRRLLESDQEQYLTTVAAGMADAMRLSGVILGPKPSVMQVLFGSPFFYGAGFSAAMLIIALFAARRRSRRKKNGYFCSFRSLLVIAATLAGAYLVHAKSNLFNYVETSEPEQAHRKLASSSIRIENPNSDTTKYITGGTRYSLSWNTTGISTSSSSVYYSRCYAGSSTTSTMTTTTSCSSNSDCTFDYYLYNDGSATYTVPSSYATGSYYICLQNRYDSGVYDYSSRLYKSSGSSAADDSVDEGCYISIGYEIGSGVTSIVSMIFKLTDLYRKAGGKVSPMVFLYGDLVLGLVSIVFALGLSRQPPPHYRAAEAAAATTFMEALGYWGGAANKFRLMKRNT